MAQKHRLTSASLAASLVVLALSTLALAAPQDSAADAHTSHQDSGPEDAAAPNLHAQVAELRAKVARLEAALELGHQSAPSDTSNSHGRGMQMGKKKMGMSSPDADMGMGMGMMSGPQMDGSMSGMKMGMGMGGMKMDMGMSGMTRMRMMGSMGGEAAAQPLAQASFLPGFPGASHIYHIGATSHFLDHEALLAPSPEQRRALAELLEQSALNQASLDRRIAEAEQQLWVLTSAGEPDASLIETKVKEVASLQAEQRLTFIRSVGAAASVLTAEQRAALVGTLGSKFAAPTPDAEDANHDH